MDGQIAFIIGAPRSGTTLLSKILAKHADIKGGPEPHLLTPLAHLGVWRNVDKAPYDHIVAGIGQRDFVAALPAGEADYWRACQAYAESLYTSFLSKSDATICLDKTPEYATVWPFIAKVFPQATFIVLTRHPAAIFSSFANSFFAGDYALSQQHDPLFERYIPAIASLLASEVPHIHVRYEDLVADPEHWVGKICCHMGIEYSPELLDYREQSITDSQGLGDPIGVKNHSRPDGGGASRWAEELAGDKEKYQYLQQLLQRVDSEEIRRFGYDPDEVWSPVEALLNNGPRSSGAHSSRWTRYKLQRQLIIQLRNLARNSPVFRKLVNKLGVACDVILREY